MKKTLFIMLAMAMLLVYSSTNAFAFSLFGGGGGGHKKNNHHFTPPPPVVQFNPEPYMLPEKNPHISDGETPGTFIIDNPGHYTGIFTNINGNGNSSAPVPEPQSWLLFGSGLAMLVVRVKNRYFIR